jgi:Tol biopolymer transport system component
MSSRDGTFGIHLMDADGRNVRRITDKWSDLLAASPDGKYLLVVGRDLHILRTDGEYVRQVTHDELLEREADWHIPRSIVSVAPFGKHVGYWGWLKTLGTATGRTRR